MHSNSSAKGYKVTFVDEWLEQSWYDYMKKRDSETLEVSVSDIIKEYPTMFKVIVYHKSYQLPTKAELQTRKKQIKDSKKESDIHRSVRRSRQAVKDIIMSNDWSYWCTFTFDKRFVDRYDFNACQRKMTLWFRRNSNLEYISVPEYHKDGAIHFHALLSNYNGTLKDTGHKTKNGQIIYKGSYSSGHAKFIKIHGDKEQLANYMIKQYITKDMIKIHNRKRYTTSRNLKRPIHHINKLKYFKLDKILYNKKPDYINESYEVHYISKVNSANLLTTENQLTNILL